MTVRNVRPNNAARQKVWDAGEPGGSLATAGAWPDRAGTLQK